MTQLRCHRRFDRANGIAQCVMGCVEAGAGEGRQRVLVRRERESKSKTGLLIVVGNSPRVPLPRSESERSYAGERSGGGSGGRHVIIQFR